MRLLLVAGLAVQPIGWFVPPWITTGQPFLAATHAADYNGHLGSDVLRSILVRGVRDQLLPALILAVAAVVITWVRDRNRVILAIGAFIAGWWVVVVGETLDGYPGLERFFLPAAALTTVLGGVGLAELARLAGGLAGSLRRPVTAAVAVVLGAVCIPFSTAQISVARTDERSASQASTCSTPSPRRWRPRAASMGSCRAHRVSRRSTTPPRPRWRGATMSTKSSSTHRPFSNPST